MAQAIKSLREPGFPEPGMEEIYGLEMKEVPVTAGVDVNGETVHKTGLQIWKQNIELKNT